MKTKIYALMTEEQGIRYVGKTRKTLEERLYKHNSQINTKSAYHYPVYQWMRESQELDQKVKIEQFNEEQQKKSP